MPCGHHFGYHCGYASPPGYPCPRCGYYHAPGYGPGWYQGWAGYGAGYGPPQGWAPVPPPTAPGPWAPPGYGPAAPATLSDEDIRRAVDSYLRSDPRISPQARIEVEVSKGVITLAGSVPDKWVKQAANEIVFAIPGVVDVQNNLQIARPTSGGPKASSTP